MLMKEIEGKKDNDLSQQKKKGGKGGRKRGDCVSHGIVP